MQDVLVWTDGQPFLTQKVCQFAANEGSDATSIREEHFGSIEELVHTHLITDWEAKDHPEHFRTIRNRLLHNDQQHTGRILELYRDILDGRKIPVDKSFEHKELRLSGLVVERNDVLTVFNRVYAEIFNRDWVDSQLDALRPYSHAMKQWSHSGQTDSSYLLKGKALQSAQEWSSGRSLTVEDYQFLEGSQRFQARQMIKRAVLVSSTILTLSGLSAVRLGIYAQHQFEKAEQAENRAERADNRAEQADNQAKEFQNLANTFEQEAIHSEARASQAEDREIRAEGRARLAANQAKDSEERASRAETTALQAEGRANAAEKDADQAKEDQQKAEIAIDLARQGTRLEQAGNAAMTQFRSNSVEALLSAMKAGLEVEQLAKEQAIKRLEDYPAASPSLALHTILDNIWPPPKVFFHGHQDNASTIRFTFSPDGQRLATASYDGTVRIWDLNGQQLAVLPGQQGNVNTITFSPDGQRLATASNDGTARIWDLNGQQLAMLKGHHSWSFKSIVFSPDGQRLATVSNNGDAHIWDLSGRQLAVLQEDSYRSGGASNIVFSSDGQRLATASGDNTARIWNLNGQQLAVLQGHRDDVSSISFSPDGQKLVTASYDGTARIWDLDGQPLAILQDPQSLITSVVFSPDSQRLATALQDGTTRIWDLDGQQLTILSGPTKIVNRVVFSPDGQRLATSQYKKVRLWDLSTGQQLAVLPGHRGYFSDISFSPDGQWLATASFENSVSLWHLNNDQHHSLQTDSGRFSRVVMSGQRRPNVSLLHNPDQRWFSSVAFSPDGQLLATASHDGTVRIWDHHAQNLAVLRGHQDMIDSIVFSADNQRITTVSWKGPVRLWDLNGRLLVQVPEDAISMVSVSPNGQYLATVPLLKYGHSPAYLWRLDGRPPILLDEQQYNNDVNITIPVVFSPDSQKLAVTLKDNTVRILDLDGRQLAVLQEHQSSIMHTVFSSDNQKIATASADRTARVWNLSGEQLAVLRGHQDVVSTIVFSPDNQRLATTSPDGSARVWALSGEQLTMLRGHQDVVSTIVFSPDNQRLATASPDGSARIWDFDGRPLAIWQGDYPVKSIVFSADGQQLAITTGDGSAHIWDIPTLPMLLAEGCQWLHAYLPYDDTISEADKQLCHNIPLKVRRIDS